MIVKNTYLLILNKSPPSRLRWLKKRGKMKTEQEINEYINEMQKELDETKAKRRSNAGDDDEYAFMSECIGNLRGNIEALKWVLS
jgi:hypothetical protein